MKHVILVLAMLLTTSLAYNQTSRKTTDTRSTRSRANGTNTVYASNKSTNAHTNQNVRKHETTQVRTTKTTRGEHVDNNRHSTYSSRRVYTSHPRANKIYHTKHIVSRSPVNVDIRWTPTLHNHYVKLYPQRDYWNYSYGYRISNIPDYKAGYFIGEVKNVYGRVDDFYYSQETDEYFLYMGSNYPYQNFTVVLPGYIARKKSRRPGYYFLHQHINVTGLLTAYEGKPEIVVKAHSQLNVY